MAIRTPEQAVAWGRKQINAPAEDYERECQRFVRLCFNVTKIVPDAGTSWDVSRTKHVVKRGVEVPFGVPVHFELASEADHTALSIGDGLCLTNDFKRSGRIDIASIDSIYKKWGATRLGWTEDVSGIRVINTPEPSVPVKPRAQSIVFGADASHFQFDNGLRVGNLADQGYEFVMLKCTQGTRYADSTYPDALAQAVKNRTLTAAYHFLEHGNAVAQAGNLAAHIIDKTIPVMLDTEPTKGSRPTISDVNAFTVAAVKLGLNVTMDYLPEWYWKQINRPSLAGRRLVASGYPSSKHDYGSRLYPGNDDSHWHSYGGASPVIWQFTSTGKIDGYTGNLDLNAFRGNLAALKDRHLFRDWGTPSPTPPVPLPRTTVWNLQFNSQHTDSGLRPALQLRDTVRLADVIGLNEIESNWQRAMLKSMTRYSMFPTLGVASQDPILWNKKRFKLLASGSVFAVDGVAGYVNNKYVNWVYLQDRTTGKKFHRVNYHAPREIEKNGHADSTNTRLGLAMKGFQTLRNVVQDRAKVGPVVGGGDFNVDYLAEARLKPGERTTWFPLTLLGSISDFDTPHTGTLGTRLVDWVFHAGKVTAGKSRVLSLGASDHRAVLTPYSF